MAFLVASIDGIAAGGQLDVGFGIEGIAVLEPNDRPFTLSAPTVLEDGSILVCRAKGYFADSSEYGGFVYRLLPNGLLDDGFGSGGRFSFDAVSSDWPCAIAVQHDGRIIVLSGSSVANGTGPSRTATQLLRLNVDGTQDRTFGPGGSEGRVDFAVGDYSVSGKAVAIQSDGAIVVGIPLHPNRFGIARFDRDGIIDGTFGDNGLVTIQFPWDLLGIVTISDVMVDSRQRIVIAGSISTDPVGRNLFAATRLLQDGSIDSAFANSGLATIDFSGRSATERTAFLQDGDRVVLAGAAATVWPPNSDPGNSDIGVARLLDDGTPDPSFGTAGMGIVPIDSVERAFDIAFSGHSRKNGGMVLAGRTVGADFRFSGMLLELDRQGEPNLDVGSRGAWIFDGTLDDRFVHVFTGVDVQGDDYIVTGLVEQSPGSFVAAVMRISSTPLREGPRRAWPADLIHRRTR